MRKLNIAKTRIIIFETQTPVYQKLLESVNRDYYDVVAVVDNGSNSINSNSVPVLSFLELSDFSFWDLLIINDEVFETDIYEIMDGLNIPDERFFS